jgi:hypothetical protein
LGKEYGKRCEVVGNNMGMHGNYVGTIIKKPFGKAYGINIRNTCWARMGIVGIT